MGNVGQIPQRAAKSVEARHHQRIAFTQDAQHLGQLIPVVAPGTRGYPKGTPVVPMVTELTGSLVGGATDRSSRTLAMLSARVALARKP